MSSEKASAAGNRWPCEHILVFGPLPFARQEAGGSGPFSWKPVKDLVRCFINRRSMEDPKVNIKDLPKEGSATLAFVTLKKEDNARSVSDAIAGSSWYGATQEVCWCKVPSKASTDYPLQMIQVRRNHDRPRRLELHSQILDPKLLRPFAGVSRGVLPHVMEGRNTADSCAGHVRPSTEATRRACVLTMHDTSQIQDVEKGYGPSQYHEMSPNDDHPLRLMLVQLLNTFTGQTFKAWSTHIDFTPGLPLPHLSDTMPYEQGSVRANSLSTAPVSMRQPSQISGATYAVSTSTNPLLMSPIYLSKPGQPVNMIDDACFQQGNPGYAMSSTAVPGTTQRILQVNASASRVSNSVMEQGRTLFMEDEEAIDVKGDEQVLDKGPVILDGSCL